MIGTFSTSLGPLALLVMSGYYLPTDDVDFKVVAVTKRMQEKKKTAEVNQPRAPLGWAEPQPEAWNVEVIAEVQQVRESKTGLKPGSRILIRYNSSYVWGSHPILAKGETWAARLNVQGKEDGRFYALWMTSSFCKPSAEN